MSRLLPQSFWWSVLSARLVPMALLWAVLMVLTPTIFIANTSKAQAITFQQILRSPDDLRLNLEYARQEVKSGRLQQAASALERLLLKKPNWDTIRLFYGVVLYRLGDIEGSKRELTVLDGRDLTPRQEKDRVKFLTLAQKETATTRITTQFTIGGRWDDNAGRVSDAAAFLAVPIFAEADTAVSLSSRFRIETDISTGQGDYWFAQSDSYLMKYSDLPNSNMLNTTLQTGFVFHGEDVLLRPYAIYSRSKFQHELFRQTWGGGARISWAVNPQTELYVNGEYLHENYNQTSFSLVGDQRDGQKVTGLFGVVWKPKDTQKFVVEGKLARKEANFDGFSYDFAQIKVNSLTLLGEGRYVTLTGRYSITQYDEPDLFTSNTITREDQRYYARAAYGAPLRTIFSGKDLPRSIADIVAQIGVAWTSQDSSISMLRFNNLSADIMLTKRTEF